MGNFIGLFNIEDKLFDSFNEESNAVQEFIDENNNISIITNILSSDERNFLVEKMYSNNSIPVGIDGIAANYVKNSKIHSLRSTLYSEVLAKILYDRVKDFVGNVNNPYMNMRVYEPYGINPAFRFIHYEKSGMLVPHYDFPYKKDEKNMSLMSIVFYLTDNPNAGETRFVKEYRKDDNSDWNRCANENEITDIVNPKVCSALLFPHNLLHEGRMCQDTKIIIRTDVMYKEV